MGDIADWLIRHLAEELDTVGTDYELDELPEGSIIYCNSRDGDSPVMLVKDLCEKVYLGNPVEWFSFSTRATEILLIEDFIPSLPALLIVRGDEEQPEKKSLFW